MYTSGRSTMHVMVRFCNRNCRCMTSLRGGPHALKQLQRAGRYAKMVNLPLAIYQAPEGPRDVLHAKSHCLERLCRMVALWCRKLKHPSRHCFVRYENTVPRAAGSLLEKPIDLRRDNRAGKFPSVRIFGGKWPLIITYEQTGMLVWSYGLVPLGIAPT